MTDNNPTTHRLIHADARDLSFLADESVHLIVTSPPYWNLKRYNEHDDQLGHIDDYERFLDELEKVWRHAFRVLAPGGRLVLHGYTPEQVALGTGGPRDPAHMYTEALLRDAFPGWRIERLASYERDVQEGRGHSGRSALIDFVARKP